ncbi:MAG TPA: UTP--glucose-1-phosphate uridylyltransferase, partial [Candidatus Limnocylindrales bacterium]
RTQHEQIRADLRNGRIGLALNRLPANTRIEDVPAEQLFDATCADASLQLAGLSALSRGEVAVVTYAAGVGSRWTQGAGVVKGLHPFARLGGRHRSFIETHLARTRRLSRVAGVAVPHVFTTSHLTHTPIERWLRATVGDAFERDVWLSPGRSIGLRLVPTVRDLHFAWEETAQQKLDEQKEKMRESVRAALVNWARATGEGADYTDNLPEQCLHPVGHWFEVPNLLKNGTLARLLALRPQLRTLVAHNIDTLGASPDPAMLGWFQQSGATLGWEVIPKRIDDHGGGLALVDGRLRLVEGLALPHEEDEFNLTYYNTNTCWIDIDRLLATFGLARGDLADAERTAAAVRTLAARLPTYVTLKDVKKRWGHGQE